MSSARPSVPEQWASSDLPRHGCCRRRLRHVPESRPIIGRTAAPHRILDPAAGPLIGVKLHVLTRKTLGGIQTDLSSRALGHDGLPIPGLYAAGEVAGFGGGGVHGYNALEGTSAGNLLRTGGRPRPGRRALSAEPGLPAGPTPGVPAAAE